MAGSVTVVAPVAGEPAGAGVSGSIIVRVAVLSRGVVGVRSESELAGPRRVMVAVAVLLLTDDAARFDSEVSGGRWVRVAVVEGGAAPAGPLVANPTAKPAAAPRTDRTLGKLRC